MTLEQIIKLALPHLREITFHTDGNVLAKSGARAPKPKKLYSGRTAKEAIIKLIRDQYPNMENAYERIGTLAKAGGAADMVLKLIKVLPTETHKEIYAAYEEYKKELGLTNN